MLPYKLKGSTVAPYISAGWSVWGGKAYVNGERLSGVPDDGAYYGLGVAVVYGSFVARTAYTLYDVDFGVSGFEEPERATIDVGWLF